MSGVLIGLDESITISAGVLEGASFAEIARWMHRAKSTISRSREVKRNGGRVNYHPTRARGDTISRARRTKLRTLVIHTQLATFVEASPLTTITPNDISNRD